MVISYDPHEEGDAFLGMMLQGPPNKPLSLLEGNAVKAQLQFLWITIRLQDANCSSYSSEHKV
jgi:hypothetical protein